MQAHDCLGVPEEAEDAVQPIPPVPPGMEGLEHVDELRLVKTIDAGYGRIKVMDHILPLVDRERLVLDTAVLRPSCESVVGARKASKEGNDALP